MESTMTQRIVTALMLGFLACTFSFLPITTAQAGCQWRGTGPVCAGSCVAGEREVKRQSTNYVAEGEPPFGAYCYSGTKALCCTADAGPGAPPPSFGGWAGANIDRPGADFANFDLNGAFPSDCRDACARDGRCQAWTFVKPGVQGPKARCWLKSSVPPPQPNTCCVSDVMERGDLGVH
jgi:hypothetical protein